MARLEKKLTAAPEQPSQPEAHQTATAGSDETIFRLISPVLEALGYEAVAVEIHLHRHKKLRIFIDYLKSDSRIGIDDCVAVSRALDEKLDTWPEVEGIFKGAYELEVSSPGIERPLRQPKDYERFAGNRARIHVFRPLTAEELQNPDYQARNPKQKNFVGKLLGINDDRIVLDVADGIGGAKKKKGKKAEAEGPGLKTEVRIPLSLVSKANLEPDLDFQELGRGKH